MGNRNAKIEMKEAGKVDAFFILGVVFSVIGFTFSIIEWIRL